MKTRKNTFTVPNRVLMIAFEYNSCYYIHYKTISFYINIFISRESRAHDRECILLTTFDFISPYTDTI